MTLGSKELTDTYFLQTIADHVITVISFPNTCPSVSHNSDCGFVRILLLHAV